MVLTQGKNRRWEDMEKDSIDLTSLARRFELYNRTKGNPDASGLDGAIAFPVVLHQPGVTVRAVGLDSKEQAVSPGLDTAIVNPLIVRCRYARGKIVWRHIA
ncbi:MAG: hypothetical protein HY671_11895 [Chloroflexi bacterium]|nr:hypothetical protein [Chloroflexota bacterium]